jgi:hypothetical protein
MRYLICVLLLCGCDDTANQKPAEFTVTVQQAAERHSKTIAAIDSTRQEIVSQNEQIIDTLKIVEAKLIVPTPKSEEVIQSTEPQEAPRANLSQPIIPVAQPSAVRLFVSHAPFHCPPCERLERAVTNGEFDGFEVVDGGDFSGLRSYPAIRFETPTTATGWGVLYGYDNSTIPTLRALTGAIKEQPVTLTDRGTRSPVVRIRSTRRGFFGLFR